MIKHFAFVAITSAMVFLWAPEGRSREFASQTCSEVAHIAQEAWQEGVLTRGEAVHLIESCLEWDYLYETYYQPR